MKGRTIVLDHIEDREAAALMVDGKLDDFLIAADAPTPGTIYRARADRPVKGQGGMFLTTPDGPAFLRQVKGLAPGTMLLVQVSGYAEPGKAIPVSNRILFKSRYAIVTPEAPGLNISRSIRDEEVRDQLLEIAHEQMGDSRYGLILRSCCVGADANDIAEDILAMLAQADQVMNDDGTEPEILSEGDSPHILAWRDWTDPAEVVTRAGGFETHGVLDALDVAHGVSEPLPGGGYLYIEPTRALVAVDVNTGADTSLAAGTKANFACAKLLPRALRVRGLAGQITLDLAPMPKKDRRGFESALRAAFKSDPDETILAGWTPLGHFELQRKRSRLPLAEILK
ncbi:MULTISPECIES: ribonuclease E/G [unclassified Ruegeria]|uniref:ribonuclease E/G n=1 Tax=unclassified Ruegeria TaxID=2625375 RepID=UPI001489E48D|nr:MULTISPECIES: ribonuclease E/G [unclassified Ruegeria]NOD62083.1 ribonuclease G [Ruegeria sp. HKCCD6109]